ncbi:MAG: hypothetical protein IJ696_02340 [Ruminococcus sp.]|nr:hypothetical protein [Ruminococcus sp.]
MLVRYRRLSAAVTAVAVGFMLGSCTLTGFTVEGALSAPKLSAQQSQINKALINSVGGNITLKYPRNGDNRSAYVIANVDDEPDNEALVFYEYTSLINGTEGIRINLLDTDENGEWYSVKELAGAGSDVDRVLISYEGNSDIANIVVGYQNIGISDKMLEIYRYKDNSFERIGQNNYSLLEAADLDGDGYKNFVTVNTEVDDNGSQSGSSASLIRLKNNEIKNENTISLCDNMIEYLKSTVGRLNDNSYAIYVDGTNSKGELQTDVLFYRYGALQDPIAQRQSKLAPMTTRPAGYYCADIDKDGEVEIPHTSVLRGYDSLPSEEKLYRTEWLSYKDFYTLSSEYSGFYSVSDGYFFNFLQRWGNDVTVKKDAVTGEFVFYKFGGDIDADMTELMRIAVESKNDSGKYIDDGYRVIDSVGQIDYLLKLPTIGREALIPTFDEVKNSFYII